MQLLFKKVWRLLKKLKIELPYDPFLGIYSKEIKSVSRRYLHSYVHCSIIHNNQEIETTQMSIKGWMGKEKAVYDTMKYYSAIKKKEILSYAAKWMNLDGFSLSDKS